MLSPSAGSRAAPLVLFAAMIGCGEEGQDGLVPVGGGLATDAERARFVRRLHLDVLGETPDEATQEASVGALGDGADSVETREALVDELWGRPEAAAHWTGELEARLFPGTTASELYALQCRNARFGDPTCRAACGNPGPDDDPCACDGCPILVQAQNERAAIAATPERLAAGDPTGALERNYASVRLYAAGRLTPETLVTALFMDFLDRPPEPEELEHAARIASGGIGAVSGILFQRHGGSYEDLVAIVFESEPYAEASVVRVFRRYLGRDPRGGELVHFTRGLPRDPATDVQDLVRAVLTSEEYFTQ